MGPLPEQVDFDPEPFIYLPVTGPINDSDDQLVVILPAKKDTYPAEPTRVMSKTVFETLSACGEFTMEPDMKLVLFVVMK